jgi:hypothetical protein
MANLTWKEISRLGNTVFLKIGMWSARAKTNLGYSEDEKKQISNTARFVTDEAMEEIVSAQGKLRGVLDSHGAPFMSFRGARFVPTEFQARLESQLTEAKLEFDTAVAKFLENYELHKTNGQLGLLEQLKKMSKSEAEGIAEYNRLVALYPSKAELAQKFSVKWWAFNYQGIQIGGGALDIKEESDQIREFLKETIKIARDELAGRVEEIQKYLVGKGKLRKNSVESTLELLDRLNEMNVLGDRVLSEQIYAVRTLLTSEKLVTQKFSTQFAAVKRALEQDENLAIADAEAKISGLGTRKLDLE